MQWAAIVSKDTMKTKVHPFRSCLDQADSAIMSGTLFGMISLAMLQNQGQINSMLCMQIGRYAKSQYVCVKVRSFQSSPLWALFKLRHLCHSIRVDTSQWWYVTAACSLFLPNYPLGHYFSPYFIYPTSILSMMARFLNILGTKWRNMQNYWFATRISAEDLQMS